MATALQNIYCMLMYLTVCIVGYNWNVNSKYRNRNQREISWTIFILFLIFSLSYFSDQDYFHYKILISNLEHKSNSASIEEFYIWLANWINYNYYFFRFFVWGTALTLYFKTTSIAKINQNHALYFLFVVFIGIFSYARATLGMCILFFGLTFYINSKKKLNKLIGVFILLSSYFFHHSLIIAIFLVLISLFFNINKRNMILVGIITIVLATVITTIFIHILSNPVANEYLMTKVSYYTSESYNESNLTLMGRVKFMLETGCFIVPLIYSTYAILKFKLNKDPKFRLVNVYNNSALFIILLSTAFTFLPLATNVFAYRIRYMAMIPVCLVMVKLVDGNFISLKKYKICLLIGFINEFMGLYSNLKHSL